ncbi:hypothetical protein ABE871_14555 [Enterococcus gilvus]|uniref:hypothetical protein n=1 Tax=Enterococcus gilvus TaxID=160453 RepID=UPI003D6BC920
MESFQNNHYILYWLFQILTFVGVFTILQCFIYFMQPYEYESITVKNVDKIDKSDIYNDYDVIEEIDFDKGNKFPYHKTIIISPQDSLMSGIQFAELSNDMSHFKKSNIQFRTSELEPQQYLLLRVPTMDMAGRIKINFKINYKKGSYEFSPNMRNGHEDKVVLKVKKTFTSFINK